MDCLALNKTYGGLIALHHKVIAHCVLSSLVPVKRADLCEMWPVARIKQAGIMLFSPYGGTQKTMVANTVARNTFSAGTYIHTLFYLTATGGGPDGP